MDVAILAAQIARTGADLARDYSGVAVFLRDSIEAEILPIKACSRYAVRQHCGVCRYERQEAGLSHRRSMMKPDSGRLSTVRHVSFVAKRQAHRSEKIKARAC